jgi:uncharacterized membrane protein YphA (DoxX/SURF4 family)
MRDFAMFPEGAAGLGLLAIRGSCVLAIGATTVSSPQVPLWAAAGLVFLAIGLIVGLWTRLASVLAATLLTVLTVGSGMGHAWVAGIAVLDLAALAMIGPGAYSIDARLFGRQVITLDPPSHKRGG